MAEGDNALRAEIEKVRERTRLQGLAQGLSPDDAESRASAAVAEFCTRWGIKPEMIGPAPARTARGATGPLPPRSPTGPLPPDPVRVSVDLGSSPLRSMAGGSNKTQAIRIGDLLRKTQSPPPPPPPGPGVPTPASSVAGAHLSAFLQKVRSKPLVEAPPPAPPPPPSPPAPPPIQIRNIPVHDQVAASGRPGPARGAPPAPAAPAAPATLSDRRRALIEEFDRTYAEVQNMLEARIGIDAVALGQTGGAGLGTGGPYSQEEVQAISRDLERLMGGLNQMMTLCQELMDHLGGFVSKDGTGGDAAS